MAPTFRACAPVIPIAVLVALLFAPRAGATVLLPAEFREIVGGSQLIVYGRVVEAAPELTADRKRIETRVTIEVGTWLKGGAGERVTIRVPGGQVGRYRSITVGAPAFEPGDEAVFFLRAGDGAEDLPSVFGLNQGVFRVERDERSLRRLVMPPPMGRGQSFEAVVRGARERQPVALETFGAQVLRAMAELAGAAR